MKNNLNILELDVNDYDFLRSLSSISSPPQKIFSIGHIPDKSRSVAIVGTRKSSTASQNAARELAQELAANNFIIISGLALGIDTAAHQGALDKNGITVAVLANGLDSIYPAQNQNLAEKIINSGGCLISEYSPKTPSYPNQFILRNRIISGLADKIIVIEAPKKSGALATAEFARKQGKEIYVLPGPANSDLYYGSHQLIREGARLIRSAGDFLDDIGFKKLAQPELKMYDLNCVEQAVFNSLNRIGSPASVDKICEMTKLSAREVGSAVSSLLFKDVASEENGKYSVR